MSHHEGWPSSHPFIAMATRSRKFEIVCAMAVATAALACAVITGVLAGWRAVAALAPVMVAVGALVKAVVGRDDGS